MKGMITAILALGALVSCGQKRQDAATPVTFDDVLATRRSVRDFDASKSVSEAEVREILTAAQDAPSWANTQSARYYVAISPEKADAVRSLLAGSNPQKTAGAHVFIVSTFVKGQSGHFHGVASNEIGDGWGAYDNGLANAYLVLKARALGLDTLIMGIRDADALRALLGIPEEEVVMAVIALGHRASDPQKPNRKPLDDIAKFF